MTTALVASSSGPGAPALRDDLVAVGVAAVTVTDRPNLVQAVLKHEPDVVILFEGNPDAAFFAGFATLAGVAPRPVVVFTSDGDAEKIALATGSGVHAYVVNGYSQNRLRSVIHLAQARFRHDQVLREELSDLNKRFAERKLVDRAKGILMGARQLREDEAYSALRRAAMHTKQRIGQVSQQVIDSARYAEAVNRAGQLRMLSQRLVKLYALAGAGVRPAETAGLFSDSVGHVDSNLGILGRSLSKATFGDLLDAVLAPWKPLRAALQAPPLMARLAEVDRLAEEMLLRAEQLTGNLEVAAFAAALRVVNVAGRQRMLSQRVAKGALLGALLGGAAAAEARDALSVARAELVAGFAYLHGLPLSNADIARELAAAQAAWEALDAASEAAGTARGRDTIAGTSEVLLGHFDTLTNALERAVQALA